MGATFLRPMLDLSRQELRTYLRAIGAAWVEDPSNQNPRYLRARTRKTLAGLDISAQSIASSARHLAEARTALDALADLWQPRAFAQDRGTLIPQPALFDAPTETQRRLLARALLWLSPAPYPPRGAALSRFLAALAQGKPATLAGARFHAGRLYREARGLPPEIPAHLIWDARFTATAPPGCTLGALGPEARATDGLPRAALAASPAIRRDGTLLAAPFAGLYHPEITLRPVTAGFAPLTAALSH